MIPGSFGSDASVNMSLRIYSACDDYAYPGVKGSENVAGIYIFTILGRIVILLFETQRDVGIRRLVVIDILLNMAGSWSQRVCRGLVAHSQRTS